MALLGAQRPRLEHIPTYTNKAAGEDAVEAARKAGLYLDDWQKYVLISSMGRDESDLWTSFEILLICSRQNGKGSIYEAREIFGLFYYPSDRLLIHTAHEHKTASEHFLRVWTLVENTPSLIKNVERHSTAYGREFIQTKPKPTIILGPGGHQIRRVGRKRLLFIARSGGSGRGFTGDFIGYDEAMFLDAGKVSASLPSLSARPNPQVFYAGSSGFKTSTQMAKLRRRGEAKSSKRQAFFEWSAEVCDEYCEFDCTKHDDPWAEETFAKTNPAYGIRITQRFWENEKEAFDGNTEEWCREHLGVGTYPAPENGWFTIPEKWFNACADKSPEPERVRQPVFAIDITPDRSAAAIAVAGVRPSDERVGLQIVEHKAGTGWIVARAKAINEKWKPACWVIDKRSETATVISELEKLDIRVETMQAANVAQASGLLYDAFRDDKVRHYNQRNLRVATAGSDWRKLSESRAFSRDGVVDICPLMSGAFAYWGYMEFAEEDYGVKDSVYFGLERVKELWRAGHYNSNDIKRLYDRGILNENDLEALAAEGISF